MIIKSSSIGMESARTYTSVSAKSYHSSGSLIAFPGILSDAYGAKEKQDVSKEEEKNGSDRHMLNLKGSVTRKRKIFHVCRLRRSYL